MTIKFISMVLGKLQLTYVQSENVCMVNLFLIGVYVNQHYGEKRGRTSKKLVTICRLLKDFLHMFLERSQHEHVTLISLKGIAEIC